MNHRTCGECHWAELKKKSSEDWYLCFFNPPKPERDKEKRRPEVHKEERACAHFKDAKTVDRLNRR